MSWQPYVPDDPLANDDLFGSGGTSYGDEDGEQEEQEHEFTNEKDSILFLIDCQESMFKEALDGDTEPFFFAMKCASHVYSDKIISASSDLLGIVFYGTKEKKNQFDFDNIYLYQDFDLPDANRIKDIEQMCQNKADFEYRYGHHKNKNNMYEALWTCQHLFSHVPKNVGFKRIFLFTNDDNPTLSSNDIRKKCVEKAKDLIDSDITIELFILKKKEQEFNASVFWEHVIGKSDDEFTGRIFDSAESFNELREQVRKKVFKKRPLVTVPWELGNGVSLDVSLFNMVQKAKKNSYIWLHSDTNKPLKSETKYICEDTAKELMNSDIKYAYEYGGEVVQFEKEEILKIKKLASHGLKLLGFKPTSYLKTYHNVKSSSFIYPNDNTTTGSSIAFAALHKKMLEMDKIAICRLIAREASTPIYVCLLPQAEILDENGSQTQGPGFHVIYLPFADGIRKLQIQPLAEENKSDQEQVAKAKKMIQKLNIDFSSELFENPALQKHFSTIQSMALEREPEEIVDYTKPDEEGYERYKDVIGAFRNSVLPQDYNPYKKLKSYSKPTGTRTGTKRVKKEEVKEEGEEGEGNEESTEKPKKRRRVKKEAEEEAEAAPKARVKKEVMDEDDEEQQSSQGSRRRGKTVVKKEVVDDDEEQPAATSKSSRKKKAKADEEDGEEEQIDIVALAKQDKLEKLTLVQLKEFLKMYKLPVSGKKADLVERVLDYLKKRGKI